MLADDVRRERHGDRDDVRPRRRRRRCRRRCAGRRGRRAAGEVRIVGTPATLERPRSRASRSGATAAGDVPLSAFSLADLEQRWPRGRCRCALLEELQAGGPRARRRGAVRSAAGRPSARSRKSTSPGLRLARLTIDQLPSARLDCRLPATWPRCSDASASIRAFAPLPRTSNPRCPRPATTTSSAWRSRGCWSTTSRRFRWTGRSTARSSRRSRSRSAPTTSTACRADDDESQGRRRAPLEEIRRNIRAAGLEPVERNGRFESDDACMSADPPRRRRVSERAAARLRPRSPAALRAALRRAVAVRRAAARGRDRSRADSVDRVPARPRLPHRAGPGDRLGRAGRVGGALQHAADRATSDRSRSTPARARRWRCCAVLCARWFEIDPTFVAHGAGSATHARASATRRSSSATTRCSPTTSQRRGVEKIDLGEAWTAMTGLPFVYAFWAGRPGVVAPDDVAALQ